jgi:acetolactate synthase I/II/III large subunit
VRIVSGELSVAQVLVRYLKECGVRHIFGVSGHSVFDITDAIYQEPDIELIPAQMELSAAYMADGYARATRGLGVCLASSGAGATNLLTGIAQAYKESTPVMAFAADVENRLAGRGASSWHEVPQAELFRPITKLSRTISRPEETLDALREAHKQALSGRQGPVYLGLRVDVQRAPVAAPPQPWVGAPSSETAVDERLIATVADELRAAAAPTIVAGGGVYWARAEAELRELAELLGAPVGTPHSQKGLLAEDHPLALGVLGFGAFPFAHEIALESDLILAVGTTFSEGLTLGYGHRVIPPGARIIQVDADPAEIGKIYPVQQGIVGDARVVLRALIDRLKASGVRQQGPPPRLERIAAAKRAWLDDLESRARASEGPINQWQLYQALRRVVTDDTIVVGEGGTGELLQRFVATSKVHHSGDFRAIGHGLSAAIAIRYAFPDQPVICVSGDGSFMMELQELATAARAGLALLIIVVNNSAYGNMKRDQVLHYGGRVIGTELYLPDLPALAASFHVHAERVERPAELEGAMRRGLAVGGTALIEVVCPIEGL